MSERKIPLDLIVDSEKNVYELATVAMRDAEALAADNDSVAERAFLGRPLVSVALDEVYHGEVEYRFKDDTDGSNI